jgi:hypothetical protein
LPRLFLPFAAKSVTATQGRSNTSDADDRRRPSPQMERPEEEEYDGAAVGTLNQPPKSYKVAECNSYAAMRAVDCAQHRPLVMVALIKDIA